MLWKNTCSYFNMVGRVNDAVYMPRWCMLIFSFFDIFGPLNTWLLIKKKEKKKGERKIQMKLSKF